MNDWHTLFDEGIAVGIPDIRNDLIVFFHHGDRYQYPTSQMPDTQPYGGYQHTIPIGELKTFEAAHGAKEKRRN